MVAGITAPEMQTYVENYLKRLLQFSRKDKGCLAYNIHQSIDNPCEFMMYSVWESKEAFEQHNRTPEMQEFKNELTKAMFNIQSPKTYWELLE